MKIKKFKLSDIYIGCIFYGKNEYYHYKIVSISEKNIQYLTYHNSNKNSHFDDTIRDYDKELFIEQIENGNFYFSDETYKKIRKIKIKRLIE